MSMCIEMRVSGNYLTFYALKGVTSKIDWHPHMHYSITHLAPSPPLHSVPSPSSLPFFVSSLPKDMEPQQLSPGGGLLPGSYLALRLVTIYICVLRAHFIAGHSLPWPHLRTWSLSYGVHVSRGQNRKKSV